MKYVQPYGIDDVNAPYINGDPSIGRMGSIPPAAAFEHPMRELVAVIENSQMPADEGDLEQVAKGVRSQRMNYVEDTGSVNALSVALDPPLTAYSIGLPLRVKVHATNTGAATIDAGAGSRAIKKPTGAAPAAGDLPAGGLVELVYDGTNFQMINFGGAGGGPGDAFYINIPYTVDSSVTRNLVTANFSPAITEIHAGSIIMVKMANTNNGPTNINVNGLGNKPIYALGAAALLPNDIVAGDVCLLCYDGTRWWTTPNTIILENVTINVANTTDLNSLFAALGRKRITPTAVVTIKLASGVYTPFITYHLNADRIVVEGTMLAALPVTTDFARTGNSSGARASDSANNIAMLRSRYGTEIQFNNAAVPIAGEMIIGHVGPGRITIKNVLVTGQNVYASAGAFFGAIGPAHGCNMLCDGVAVWGSGWNAFAVSQGNLDCIRCFASGNHGVGFMSYGGSRMSLYYSGSFGNAQDGCQAGVGAMLYLYNDTICQMNAWTGVFAWQGSTFLLKTTNTVTGNALFDLQSSDISAGSVNAGNVYSTASPAPNVVGNFSSLIRQF